MDRASDFGSEGWRFESVRAHQYLYTDVCYEIVVIYLQNGETPVPKVSP